MPGVVNMQHAVVIGTTEDVREWWQQLMDELNDGAEIVNAAHTTFVIVPGTDAITPELVQAARSGTPMV